MFGLIVAGRAIQANMQQVAENKFLFMIPDGYVFFALITPIIHSNRITCLSHL